jgi:hypothetical protein
MYRLSKSQIYQKQYRREHRDKLYRQQTKWRSEHPEHKKKKRAADILFSLRKALRAGTKPLRNGWPDDGIAIELKCGPLASVRWEQFRRFAWMQTRQLHRVQIRVAESSLDCSRGLYKDYSIEEYLHKFSTEETLLLWQKLLSMMALETVNG